MRKTALKIFFVIIFIILLIGIYLFRPQNQEPEIKLQPIEKIQVGLRINYGDGANKNFSNINIENNLSVFDLLLKMQAENNIELTYDDYGGDLGTMITAIDGLNNGADNYWWKYWVNDDYANMGASNYILNDGDKIEWKYVK
jgi:hypothetical protein